MSMQIGVSKSFVAESSLNKGGLFKQFPRRPEQLPRMRSAYSLEDFKTQQLDSLDTRDFFFKYISFSI